MATCAYGYAAVSTDLLISGDGAVVSEQGFSSEYMQDLTVTECAKAAQYSQKQMIDKRDGQKYWVIKYGDGNCWMAQDLKLQLSTEMVFTSELSDVEDDWSPDYDTLDTVSVYAANVNATRSYDFGYFVPLKPTASTACPNGKTTLADCMGQFLDVSDRTPSNDPNFYENNGNIAYNDMEYDAHYLVGTYYQFNAATAGTGGGLKTVKAKAPASICPRGWHLPTGITNTTGTDFSNLDMLESVTAAKLPQPPFYYTKAGYVDYSGWYKIRSAGQATYYTTGNVCNDANTRCWRTNATGVGAGNKMMSSTVRCIFYGEEE